MVSHMKIYRSIGFWSLVFSMFVICNTANAGCTKDTDCKGDRICDEGKCVNPGSPQPGHERRDASSRNDISGTWKFVANAYPGKIEFQRSSNGWTGRVWFDVYQRWEHLTDIAYDPATGSIKFFRPEAVQLHIGTVSGSSMRGTFNQGGAGSYNWEANNRAELSSLTEQPSIAGTWKFVANAYPGKIEFQRSSNGWTGRVWFDVYQRWEHLTDIAYDPATGSIKFFRPEAVQLHIGTVSGSSMRGTFNQGGAGSYNWEARK